MAEALKNPAPGIPAPAPKPPIAPKPPVGEVVDLKYVRDNIKQTVSLSTNKQVTLKEGTANWNLAADGLGLGYYDCDIYISGTGLEDGESLTVQAFIVTNGNRSGYFTQKIDGNTKGEFSGNIRLKTPLLSTAKLEIDVKSTTDAVITNYGADKYVFLK